jgi:dUTP pyrophosphatase
MYMLEIYPMTAAADEHYRMLYGDTVYCLDGDNAGVDVYTQSVEDKGTIRMVHTEIVAKLIDVRTDKNLHFYLAPRSSIWKSGVVMANSMGIIDRSYRGELMGACLPIAGVDVSIKTGDRLFQILAPDMGTIQSVYVKKYSSLDVTSRGAGGFGSTGK